MLITIIFHFIQYLSAHWLMTNQYLTISILSQIKSKYLFFNTNIHTTDYRSKTINGLFASHSDTIMCINIPTLLPIIQWLSIYTSYIHHSCNYTYNILSIQVKPYKLITCYHIFVHVTFKRCLWPTMVDMIRLTVSVGITFM